MRAVVPEPLTVGEPAGQVRGHADAERHRARLVHRVRAGAAGRVRGRAGRLPARDVRRQPRLDRQRPGDQRLSRRSSAPRRCTSTRTPSSAPWTTARCGSPRRPWASSTAPLERGRRPRRDRPAHLRAEDRCPATTGGRASSSWSAARSPTSPSRRPGRGPARLQLFEHALAPLADLPVREIVSASHIRVDLTLGRFAPRLRLPGRTSTGTVMTDRWRASGSSRWPAGWPAPAPPR